MTGAPESDRQRALEDAAALVGLLAEPDRLRTVAAAALGATTVTEVAAVTELPLAQVARAVARLAAGGLVEEDGRGGLALRPELLKDVARAAAPPPDADDHGATDPAVAAVLRTFLRDGRLVRLPAQQTKRRVVLDHVVRVFEVGRRFQELEVNGLLRAFSDDYTSLRRALVDAGMLSREGGVYWRTGGTVEV